MNAVRSILSISISKRFHWFSIEKQFLLIIYDLEILDEFRLVVKWYSSHDCIGAQINGGTKYAILKWSELPCRLIKLLKVKSIKTIASFDSKANDNQLYSIMIEHEKPAIRSNTPIIIMLRWSSKPQAKSCKDQRIEGWYKKIKSKAIP